MKRTVVAIILIILLTSCADSNANGVSDISIPNGYNFFTASSFGNYLPNTTLYIKDRDGRIYEYKKGQIGKVIIPPEGYEIVAITEYGRVWGNRQLYCKNIQSGGISKCS